MTLDPRLRLFLLSFLMLFVELALIRWLGSNVVYLGYFTNFVLLGSFLGIGIGFLRAKSKTDLFPWAPVALAALVALVVIAPSTAKVSTDESFYFQSPGATGLPIWLALPIVFILSATVMATFAEGVARQFAAFKPLNAYRLDILGSIAGILVFTLISFLGWPPIAWGIVAVALYAIVTFPKVRDESAHRDRPVVAGVVLLGALTVESTAPNTSWSAYHKVELAPSQPGVTQVRINGTPSQFIQSAESMRTVSPFFFFPYESRTATEPPKDVLMIGGGTGSDTAAALASGAEHVDVVEIDPRLVELGRAMNPDGALLDPRVDVHVTDGREFLESNDTQYDMVVFALPNSIALVAGQSGVRLESFLFTKEAIEQAKAHLAPDGVFALVDFFREPFVVDRLAGTIAEVFGTEPCLSILGDQGHLASLVVGARTRPRSPVRPPRGSRPTRSLKPRPTTIRSRTSPTGSIPDFYLLAIGLILLVSLGAVQLASGSVVRMRPYVDLFFMGAGFLLLETRNIVTFSLLFGTTWLVNALVFAGPGRGARGDRGRRPIRGRAAPDLVRGAGGIVGGGMARAGQLDLSFPWAVRLGVAIVVAFLPVFFANVMFAQRFRDVSSSTTAFGTTSWGAMVGGVLEYVAIVTGYTLLLPGRRSCTGWRPVRTLGAGGRARAWPCPSQRRRSSPRRLRPGRQVVVARSGARRGRRRSAVDHRRRRRVAFAFLLVECGLSSRVLEGRLQPQRRHPSRRRRSESARSARRARSTPRARPRSSHPGRPAWASRATPWPSGE